MDSQENEYLALAEDSIEENRGLIGEITNLMVARYGDTHPPDEIIKSLAGAAALILAGIAAERGWSDEKIEHELHAVVSVLATAAAATFEEHVEH